jgi:hypothetical protein
MDSLLECLPLASRYCFNRRKYLEMKLAQKMYFPTFLGLVFMSWSCSATVSPSNHFFPIFCLKCHIMTSLSAIFNAHTSFYCILLCYTLSSPARIFASSLHICTNFYAPFHICFPIFCLSSSFLSSHIAHYHISTCKHQASTLEHHPTTRASTNERYCQPSNIQALNKAHPSQRRIVKSKAKMLLYKKDNKVRVP